jgi:hypothetical protein
VLCEHMYEWHGWKIFNVYKYKKEIINKHKIAKKI